MATAGFSESVGSVEFSLHDISMKRNKSGRKRLSFVVIVAFPGIESTSETTANKVRERSIKRNAAEKKQKSLDMPTTESAQKCFF